MRALSKDLRERILSLWEKGEHTREEVGKRYEVSLGMVKKLIAQRKRLGHIEALWSNCGRPVKIEESQRNALREAIKERPEATLGELAAGMGVECTAQAVFYALRGMGISRKKKRSTPASETGRTSCASARGGKGGKGAGTPPASSSSTRRAARRT